MTAISTTLSDAQAYEQERGKPMPGLLHGIVQKRLLLAIDQHYANQYEAIPELNVPTKAQKRIPDIAIYPPLDINFSKDVNIMENSPLCAIEIISPKQHLADMMLKCVEYFDSGVQSYWLVLPPLQTIHVFDAPNNHTYFGKNDILKDLKLGIELDLQQIFR